MMAMTREQMDRKIDEHFGFEATDDVDAGLAPPHSSAYRTSRPSSRRTVSPSITLATRSAAVTGGLARQARRTVTKTQTGRLHPPLPEGLDLKLLPRPGQGART